MDIIDEVKSVISRSLNISMERLTPESRLDELGAESLDVIEIVFKLEEQFDIDIPFTPNEGSTSRKAVKDNVEDDMSFSTIGDIAKTVTRLVEAKTR